jgi:hypothetical protein
MPYTPIHWSIAYLAREIRPSLSLPALIVSTTVPDLEIPFIYIITDGQLGRLVLHSLLGATTIATLLSVVLTVFVYSPVVSHLFKLDSKTVKSRCRFSWSLFAVCLLGSLSHVLIDSLHHEYNPLLFPFTYDSFDALVFMHEWTLASVVVPLSFLALLVFFIAKEVRRGTKDIWTRLLVE